MRTTREDVESMLDRPVAALAIRPSRYRTSFELYELDVVLCDGTEMALVLKDTGLHALSADAARAKPPFLLDPAREGLVYRELLGRDGDWAPALLAVEVDRDCDRHWVLIERVRGRELFQAGDLETWCAVARWLARMQACLTPRALRCAAPLLRYDDALYARWAERALRFGRPGPKLRSALESWDELSRELQALPVAFLHGEFYASNILLADPPRKPSIAAIDWELAALGPGLLDLAALSSGDWDEEERWAMALAYHEAAQFSGPLADRPRFSRALALARLHLAVQWLGWSDSWTAPAHLAHDWREDGERLAVEVQR
jgi:Ser/Thr protein kinase RdoA (MazF antagonist)